VGGPLIGLTFLLHFALAARKIPFRTEQQSAMWKHSKMLHHKDTWLWVVQAVTAMIILIMGAIHMWTVLTDLPITAQKSAARIQGGFWLVFYLILLPLSASEASQSRLTSRSAALHIWWYLLPFLTPDVMPSPGGRLILKIAKIAATT